MEDLGTLPLYVTQKLLKPVHKSKFTLVNFVKGCKLLIQKKCLVWYSQEVKGKFLKSFMPQLRKQETVKRKLKTLFMQINSLSRSKRGAGKPTMR